MSVYAEAATQKLDRIKRESQSEDGPSQGSTAVRVWREARRSVCLGAVFMIVFGAVVALSFWSLPDIQISRRQWQFPPRTLDQLVSQRDFVVQYSENHMIHTLVCLSLLYIFMQTFAIPGTLTLSLMSGALLQIPRGLVLVSAISTVGACCCYGMSKLLGSQLAAAIWPERLKYFQNEVEKRKNDLLSYVIFLRLTPILPNTFINLASPIVHVPLFPFVIGTIVGCLPNNFLAVNAGNKLKEMSSWNELYDMRLIASGIVVGSIAMLPIWLRKAEGSAEKGQKAG